MAKATEPPWKDTLARKVRALREAAHATQKGIAEQSGLSLRFLADVEAGRANPSLQSLYALAGALKVDVIDLLERGPRPRHIALLGLRGAGKSTVGKRVARQLGWEFVEVDKEIEREAGMTLAELFALHGEGHYRTLEERVLRRLLSAKQSIVMATGGGVVTHDESWRVLRAHARTVWLKATPQEHWDRVIAQGDARPMQKRSAARQELEALYQSRAPLYGAADMIVDTSALDIDKSSAKIVEAAR
jgi:XRE family aerobic/anaerobic benzoate catabolism transcriptional regulator